jgi:hypothetical protein
MKLKRHEAAELERFLVAVDRALTRRVNLIVIGGSALSLGYGITSVTTDIDTFGNRTASAHDGRAGLDAIQEAARIARADTDLDIPIAESTIAQFPDGFETRLVRVLPGLEHLELWVPEVYDLAAAKLLRGNEHDRQQLAELYHLVRLDRSTLIKRFNLLLENYVGDPLEPRWSLYQLVTEIWGEVAAVDLRP